MRVGVIDCCLQGFLAPLFLEGSGEAATSCGQPPPLFEVLRLREWPAKPRVLYSFFHFVFVFEGYYRTVDGPVFHPCGFWRQSYDKAK